MSDYNIIPPSHFSLIYCHDVRSVSFRIFILVIIDSNLLFRTFLNYIAVCKIIRFCEYDVDLLKNI